MLFAVGAVRMPLTDRPLSLPDSLYLADTTPLSDSLPDSLSDILSDSPADRQSLFLQAIPHVCVCAEERRRMLSLWRAHVAVASWGGYPCGYPREAVAPWTTAWMLQAGLR